MAIKEILDRYDVEYQEKDEGNGYGSFEILSDLSEDRFQPMLKELEELERGGA